MITFHDFLVAVAVLGFAYWGWLVGLQAASIAALELLTCLGVAVMLHESVAGWLHAAAAALVGEWASQTFAVLLAFAALAWGSFAAIRLWLHRGADDEEDEADIDPLGDRIGGAVAGGFGGAVFVGGVLVTLSMIPFLAWLKPSGDRMLLDVGKTVLQSTGGYVGERHEGRPLPLWGEPASRSSNPAARLTSEPWFDVDQDGKFTDVDRYRDVDGSRTFTKDLYFEDVDGDGLRRIGLIDKYVAGRWDARLISEDRPRPEAVKPAPAASPPKPAAPPAKAPATGAKAPEKPRPETKQAPAATTAPPKPDASTPPAPKSETKKPATPQPEAKKPDAPKPDTNKPTTNKPTTKKPEAPEPEAPKPAEEKLPGDDF